MRALDIVAEYLRQNGFDGLCHEATECGCKLADLQPCGEMFADCEPAYCHDLPPGDDREFWMSTGPE